MKRKVNKKRNKDVSTHIF